MLNLKHGLHKKKFISVCKSMPTETNSATALRAYYFDRALKVSNVMMTAIHKR